ncbi:MAG: helicase-exonuclease AddAB subunit AddB [Clostridia bacterium]|nr:helicase-exonuclease AddAB subunit AddB [Clostridia bacterium]
MSLRLIYGKSGTGKSTYIFNEIKERINCGKKIYIITPEQFSFTAEKMLLETLGNMAVLNAEVLTFNRMAYRVAGEVGGTAKVSISNSGKAMLIYNILSGKKSKLKFLGKSDENIELIIEQITEFKKHGVLVDDLKKMMEETTDNYLKLKIQDILQVYSEFENKIENRYIDENDNLTKLANQLGEVSIFDNTLIYIDEFVGFTKQEYEIIKQLSKVASEVNISICVDSICDSTSPESDVFYSNKLTISRLLDMVKEEEIALESPVALGERYRFKNNELKHLENNLYAVPYKKYDYEMDNIKLFLANNQYSEIENVAINIVKLVRNNNYRYKDIAVITKSLEEYSNLVKVIFNKYQIPVFIDEKKDLSQNIIVKYLLSILEIFARNWSYESVFNYVKTGFLDISKQEIFILENYCQKWGIKNAKWYKSEWNFKDEDESNKEQIERLREIRKIIVNPLLQFKEELNGENSVKNITKKLYAFLIKNEIDKKFEEKIEELKQSGQSEFATQYETSWKIIMNVLDEIVLVFGEDKVSFDKYMQILKTGLASSDLGKIPGTQDQVIIGDVDRSRSHKVKAIFIIGLNDGMFPSVHKNEGFFNDKDRDFLKENGLELARNTVESLYEDNFNIYKAFTTAEEKLFLSYASSNSEGKTLRGSILISKIKKIFPNLREESDIIERTSEILIENTTFDELLNKLGEYRDTGEIDDKWVEVYSYYKNNKEWKYKLEKAMEALLYNNRPEKISSENISKMYGNTLKTSVSRLEQYQSCHFAYYLKYGLKLSEKDNFKINPIDTGTFMHDTIDTFFNYIKEKSYNIKDLTDEQVNNLVEEIIEEKLGLNKNYIFSSSPKYKSLSMRLKKVIFKSMKYIVESLKCSKFEVLGNEMEFKEGKEYAPIVIDLENGQKVEITGKIDRIDIAKLDNDNYVRIIDYKSSAKNIDLNQVYAGLQLQLITYLDAVCESEDFLPAGVLYFNLIDPVIKSKKSLSEEEIEEKIRKEFKMQGLILADVDVVKMMDTNLETGSSNIVPAYIGKEGTLSNTRSSSVSRKQFEYLQKYTNKLIKQISSEILSGNIDINPYYNIKNKKTACEYCEYKSVCNFNGTDCTNGYNYINNLEKEAVLEMMQEEM